MAPSSIKILSQKHRIQLINYDETIKRSHSSKYQYCKPELKKTIRLTTVGQVKDNQQALTIF